MKKQDPYEIICDVCNGVMARRSTYRGAKKFIQDNVIGVDLLCRQCKKNRKENKERVLTL